jgi:hypothetical protein
LGRRQFTFVPAHTRRVGSVVPFGAADQLKQHTAKPNH